MFSIDRIFHQTVCLFPLIAFGHLTGELPEISFANKEE